ncbi:MAG: DNA primase [Bryobacteraceae bacterium]
MELASQIKSQVDIVRVIGEYVRLQKAGVNHKGLCPFHQEKTPSFNVRGDRQYFHCFGCQKGGSVIDFVMELEGLTFWEACKQLAERYGIPIPKQRAAESDRETRERAGVYEANEIAQRIFRGALLSPAGQQAREYLAKRGVTPALIEEFGLGMAERTGASVTRKLEQAGFNAEQLEASGLSRPRQDGSGFRDYFFGRLMFPIHNETGKIIGFAGRALSDDDQPKYLNSPGTKLYNKKLTLYNLHRARKPIRQYEHCILVEGYMDVIGLYGGGVTEAIASCGTAFSDTQVRIIKRHTDNIIVNFDPDTAGADATERSLQMLLEQGMKVRVLSLPDELDPDEYIHQYGAEEYRKLMEQAPRYFHWLADRARGRFDMSSAEGRIEAVRFLLPSIQRLADKYERAAVATELADMLRIDRSLILEQVRGMRDRDAGPVRKGPSIPANEKLLLRCLLRNEEARHAVVPHLAELRSARPLTTGAILKSIAALGPDFDYDALNARLGESDRTLLAAVDFADEGDKGQSNEDYGVAQAEACLHRLEESNRDASKADLKQQVKDAERRGDFEGALRLMQQLKELEV